VATLNDPDVIADLLDVPRTWALVGCSPPAAAVAERVGGALAAHGHRLLLVNPSVSGESFGAPVRARLADLPEAPDVVDIYRRAEGVAELVDEALVRPPYAIWLQLGAVDHDAAQRALDAGVHVVMDRCPAIEYGRRGR
jgi:predicted CoA-binding protein